MRKHILNLYRLLNLHELNFSYKLVKTDLRYMPDKEDVFNRHFRKTSERVASIIEGPVAVVRRNGVWYIAIPADRPFDETRVDVGPFVVTVTALPDVFTVGSKDLFLDSNLQAPVKLTTLRRFKLTSAGRCKLTTLRWSKLTT